MKLSALLLFTLVALINCVPLDVAADFDLASREIDKNKGLFAVATLPNGRHTITVYDDGRYGGVIVEEEDGKSTIYDKDGNVVDIDDDSEDGDDEHKLRRRQRWAILWRLGAFISRFRGRAWAFIACVGGDVVLRCSAGIMECAQHYTGNPWDCIGGLFCGGKSFYSCVR